MEDPDWLFLFFSIAMETKKSTNKRTPKMYQDSQEWGKKEIICHIIVMSLNPDTVIDIDMCLKAKGTKLS